MIIACQPGLKVVHRYLAMNIKSKNNPSALDCIRLNNAGRLIVDQVLLNFSRQKSEKLRKIVKGCVHFIFASLFSKREHL